MTQQINEAVAAEKQQQREVALRLIDDVLNETLSAEDQVRLRSLPKFQELIARQDRVAAGQVGVCV
jgi:hypothetical protein